MMYTFAIILFGISWPIISSLSSASFYWFCCLSFINSPLIRYSYCCWSVFFSFSNWYSDHSRTSLSFWIDTSTNLYFFLWIIYMYFILITSITSSMMVHILILPQWVERTSNPNPLPNQMAQYLYFVQYFAFWTYCLYSSQM